jgi:hypothetical protein
MTDGGRGSYPNQPEGDYAEGRKCMRSWYNGKFEEYQHRVKFSSKTVIFKGNILFNRELQMHPNLAINLFGKFGVGAGKD